MGFEIGAGEKNYKTFLRFRFSLFLMGCSLRYSKRAEVHDSENDIPTSVKILRFNGIVNFSSRGKTSEFYLFLVYLVHMYVLEMICIKTDQVRNPNR